MAAWLVAITDMLPRADEQLSEYQTKFDAPMNGVSLFRRRMANAIFPFPNGKPVPQPCTLQTGLLLGVVGQVLHRKMQSTI